jgi:hypothetical protein
MADDQDNFDGACDRALAATYNVNDQDIFDVLMAVITYRMARICPDCRKSVARYIEKCIPDMLVDANDAAAARAHHGEHQQHATRH